jgi:hypothetical protein
MVKTAPEIYTKYIYVGSDNKNGMYVKVLKALHVCLWSDLLFYFELVDDLESHGFKINPYDMCVVNMMETGKQFTVTWYVEDLKFSHAQSNEVTIMIEWLKSIYGQEMWVYRWKKHAYLGIYLNLLVPGEVCVIMVDYLRGAIEDFPEEITGRATSPPAEHLFTVRHEIDRKPLEEKRDIAFQNYVAQLLFTTMRSRPDIHTSVAFIAARVWGPGEGDWQKLKRVL